MTWLDEHDGLIRRMRGEGASCEAIAKVIGASDVGVLFYCRRNYIRKTERLPAEIVRRVRDTERADQMAAMCRQGQTLATIGLQFGVTKQRVSAILKTIGQPRRPNGAYPCPLSQPGTLDEAVSHG